MQNREHLFDSSASRLAKDIWCIEEGWNIDSVSIISKLLKKLSVKQRIIVNMLYQGMSYQNIAYELKLDKTTIRDHLKSIRTKTRKAIKDYLKLTK